VSVFDQLTPVRQRMRLRAYIWAMTCAAVAAALTQALMHVLGEGRGRGWGYSMGSLAAAVIVAAVYAMRGHRQWHWVRVADAVEAAHHECANCVRALVDVELQRIAVPEAAHARLRAAVSDRMSGLHPSRVVPLRAPLMVLLCACLGALSIVAATPEETMEPLTVSRSAEVPAMQVTLQVTPPAYLADVAREVGGESEVPVPAGASVRLRVVTHWPMVRLEMPEADTRLELARVDDDTWVSTPVTLLSSRVFVVAAGAMPTALRESRVVSLRVVNDAPPQVSIETPGRDSVRAPGSTEPLQLRIVASDDHRLAALELRYTRLAGGGETFTFTEGTVPLTRTAASPRAWTADVRWAVGALALERGESLVYRAAVRDHRPDGDWVLSDSYVIDIGTSLEASGAGADLPEEDRRYAISQQMVIVKTERLRAQERVLAERERLEQAQLLAAEQRRVRSEVVFLSGGDIADEVEEAAHSHELQEGRLEKVGRFEMVRAMAEMSRAEAALTAGDLRAALNFERAALGALQRAFDRRRYFLRTSTERTRIDPSRRLSGDRRGAFGDTRPAVATPGGDRERLDALGRAIVEVQTSATPTSVRMAHLVALAPEDAQWRALVARWGTTGLEHPAQSSTQVLLEWLRARQLELMPPASGGLPPLPAGNGFTHDARTRRPR